MGKKSATVLLGVAIFVGGDYACEYSEAHEPRSEAIEWTPAHEYDYLLEPRLHVHSEMHTEAGGTTATYMAASGARQLELKHYTWIIKEVGPNKYDAYRDGQFMFTRSRSDLRLDGHFHSRYESLLRDLDRDHVATFQVVKGAFSQLG